ncbi:SEC10/PgrA surface exclusion domain-containing protein [Streptococcus mitis]|uniref:SEC10/PgrA surface exclusion domain-containing protein n=1 Tax=Streptococcus mitis TaxID=28037 RepID=A0A7X1V466_STRMT|nr:SEC10/PgrA surface exclusion domain-containing protein [Streptococcus mitis]MQQ52319.1 SEC10/PgrA surface exclusion domain-containing protein [Streptococcus mitis]
MDKRTKWSLAAAALVTASLAKVEDVNAKELTEQGLSSQVVTEQTSTKTVEITKEQVNHAKENVKHAEQTVENARTVNDNAIQTVTELEKQVSVAKQNVQDAETNQKASDISIAEAEDKLTNAVEQVNNATMQHSVSADQVTHANQTIEVEITKLKQATEQVNEQEHIVQSAQDRVQEVEESIRHTNERELTDALTQAKTVVEQSKDAVTLAEHQVDDAKAADNKRNETINILDEKVTQATTNNVIANNTVTNKEAEVKVAEQRVQEAQQMLNEATTTLKTLTTNQVVNTLTLSDEYIKALKEDDEVTLKRINEIVGDKNEYKSNEVDKTRSVDIRNLTYDQQLELTQFAADLINQVRKQYGSPLVTITKDSLKFANTVVRRDEANGYQMDDGHDVKVINEVAHEFGLKTGKNLQFYENLFSYGFNDDDYENEYKHLGVNADQFYTKTMDEAKATIYKSLEAFLFNGYEWEHARSVVGYTNEPAYFGLAIGHGLAVGKTHFEYVEPRYIKDPSKFDTTEIKVESPTERIEQAKAEVTNAEVTLSKAKTELVEKQTELATAKEQAQATGLILADAKEALTKAKESKEQTPDAVTKLELAKDNLRKAEFEKETAEEKLKSISKTKEEKEKDLLAAKEKLSQDNNELKSRKDNLSAIEQRYNEAVKQLTDAKENFNITLNVLTEAKQELKTAQDKVTALKNGPKLLEAAKHTLNQLTHEYEKALDLQHTSELELKKAISELTNATHEYQVIKAQYDAYQATLKPSTDVKDSKDQNLKGKKETQSANQVVSYSRVARNKELPKTGSASSVLTLIGLGALSLLGVTRSKRKKEDR